MENSTQEAPTGTPGTGLSFVEGATMLKTLTLGWLTLLAYTCGYTGYLIYMSAKHR